jgi:AAA15 family ATPase/GTPase
MARERTQSLPGAELRFGERAGSCGVVLKNIMIDKIHIHNFKSIVDLTIPLSNINVFIGENGCGKSNILEAIAFGSAAMKGDLSDVILNSKGFRVSSSEITFNSFKSDETVEKLATLLVDFDLDEIRKLVINIVYDNIEGEGWAHFVHYLDESVDKVYQEHSTKQLSWVQRSDLIKSNIADWQYSSDSEQADVFLKLQKNRRLLSDYVIFNLSTRSLRGINSDSLIKPLGIYGEGLDLLISQFNDSEKKLLLEYAKLIDWLEDFLTDERNILRFEGLKSANSNSMLYFKDKYMQDKTFFSAENANEGILFVLFYLSLFISEKTPKFFGIDNIETALNPKLCREIMKSIAKIAIQTGKQAVITTHNPAILDGLNLEDDRQRLFIVKRNDEGHTKIERIKTKPATESSMKLSEMWMRGYLGGLPTNF